MEPDFSHLFHQSSKNSRKGHPPIPEDSRLWPPEWTTIYFKEYERLPKLPLIRAKPEANFFTLIKERKSSQTALAKHPLSRYDVALILEYSCGLTGEGYKRRAQPSGGARFPLEVYPLVLVPGKDLPTGLYHYNVHDHALTVLWDTVFAESISKELFTYSWMKEASVVFLMTGVFLRNQMKYGERGYRHVLFEAGHIAQNMYLVAAAKKFNCTALAGTNDTAIEKLLDIDGVTESYLYAVVFG